MVKLQHLLSIATLGLPTIEGSPFTHRRAPDFGIPETGVRAAVDTSRAIGHHDDASRFRKAMDVAKKILTAREESTDVSVDSIRRILDQIKHLQEEVSAWLPSDSAKESSIPSTASTSTSPTPPTSPTSPWSQLSSESQVLVSEESIEQPENQPIKATPSPLSSGQFIEAANETHEPSPVVLPSNSTSLSTVFSVASSSRNSSNLLASNFNKGHPFGAKASNDSSLIKDHKNATSNTTASLVQGQRLPTLTTQSSQSKSTPTPQIAPPRGGLNGTFFMSPSRWNLTLGSLPRVTPGYFEAHGLTLDRGFRTRTRNATTMTTTTTTTTTVTTTTTITEFFLVPATPGGSRESFINGTRSGVTSQHTAERLAGTPSRAANGEPTPGTTPSFNEDAVDTSETAPQIPSQVPNYHSRAPWPNTTVAGFRTLSKPTATVGKGTLA